MARSTQLRHNPPKNENAQTGKNEDIRPGKNRGWGKTPNPKLQTQNLNSDASHFRNKIPEMFSHPGSAGVRACEFHGASRPFAF